MPKKIVMEAATLADAVQKAARIAPTKGSAFDRYAGIYIEVSNEPMMTHPVIVRSTNGDITYQQKVSVLEYDGPAFWRIPASIFANLMSTLPLDQGRTITLVDREDGAIRIAAGTVKAKLNMIPGEWTPFPEIQDIETFASASDFAAKAEQIAWATAPDNVPLSGVHLDGQMLVATDKFVMAQIPCEAPVDQPITVPLKELSRLLTNGTDVKIRAIDKKLYIMLDAETQATTTIFLDPYPNWKAVLSSRPEFTGEVEFKKDSLLDAIARMLVLVRGERYPKLKLQFMGDDTGGVQLVLDMDAPGVGRLQDTIETTGTVKDGEFEMHIHPVWLQSGLNASKSDVVKMQFGPTALHNVRITDGQDFDCLVAAINKNTEPKNKSE